MHTRKWIGLVVLVGVIGLFGLTDAVQSQLVQSPKPQTSATSATSQTPQTLKQRVINLTKLQPKDVDKFLQSIGPAIRDHLKTGETVEITGLGTFRVVNIPAHRDMIRGTGVPVTVAASNYVEFLPSDGLVSAANSAATTPNETVPPFEYIPLPGRDPGMKMGTTRQPTLRQR
jgi:nucleoid DNA-binding protein